MPRYDYKCDKCNKEDLLFLKIEHETPICDRCQSPMEQMIPKTMNFILKGGGWYSQGYGSKSSSSETKPDSSGTKADSSTSNPKKENPPAQSKKASG